MTYLAEKTKDEYRRHEHRAAIVSVAAFTRTVAFQKIGDTERVTRCVMAYYVVIACRKLLR
jgi:hypothetical protein